MAVFPPSVPDPPACSRTVLVTGFGAFPGSPRNPTERIVAQLRWQAPRLARLGIDLRCVALPVRYDELQPRLEALARSLRPDAVLHLGVAGRRRCICIETHARNRAGPLHPDAVGRCPAPVLIKQAAPVLRSTFPSRRILPALRAGRIRAQMSRDAGDYVCNATLYRSLAMALAPEVGFIHVPKTSNGRRLSDTRDDAAAARDTRASDRARKAKVRCASPRPAAVGRAGVLQGELARAALLAVLALALRPCRPAAAALNARNVTA